MLGGMYAIDAHGHEVACLHPGEDADAAQALGLSLQELLLGLRYRDAPTETLIAEGASLSALVERVRNRLIFRTALRCLDCDALAELDLSRQPRACPSCGGHRLWTAGEALGQSCPKCRQGYIVTTDTGISM